MDLDAFIWRKSWLGVSKGGTKIQKHCQINNSGNERRLGQLVPSNLASS